MLVIDHYATLSIKPTHPLEYESNLLQMYTRMKRINEGLGNISGLPEIL